MQILLIGCDGQLGKDLAAVLDGEADLRKLGHSEVEVADPESVDRALAAGSPDLIINTTAYNRVDDAEDYPDRALRTNMVGPHVLARACAKRGIALLHTSTDYVFSGESNRPWTETDPTQPINVYGISKLAGELAVRAACPRSYVVRMSGLFGLRGSRSKGGAGNFVETMLRVQAAGQPLRVVDDQVLAPTYTGDLAGKLRELIFAKQAPFGLYHMTASGSCSWYDFAREIFAFAGVSADLEPQSTAAANLRAGRPRYSVLANSRLTELGIRQIRPWSDGLQHYLAKRLSEPAGLTA